MEQRNTNGSSETRENILLYGGAALIIAGAGMILSSAAGQRYMSNLKPGTLVQAALPALQGFMKLRES